jgi:hypothetical protein
MMDTLQRAGSLYNNRASVRPVGDQRRRRSTMLNEKDFDHIMAQGNDGLSSNIVKPSKDEIIHEIDEGEDSPKNSV